MVIIGMAIQEEAGHMLVGNNDAHSHQDAV